jgi:hypothetical protein
MRKDAYDTSLTTGDGLLHRMALSCDFEVFVFRTPSAELCRSPERDAADSK